VRRPGFYEWLAAEPARAGRTAAEDQISAEIAEIHSDHRGAYGSKRVSVELRQRGRRVNRKRVERIMRQRGIVGITRRRRRSLTKQDMSAPPAPDLLGRDFSAPRPGERFVGDITYLPTQEGWLYLATVIDLHTQRHRPGAMERPGDRGRRQRPQQPAAKDARMEDPSRSLQRTATVAETSRCCDDRLNPPSTPRLTSGPR
jgi:hypothetical protein